MTETSLFGEKVIALVWDFDKTLSPHYMQRALFDAYDIDEDTFWSEVNALPGYYARSGIQVHRDICYLNHLLSYVKAGRCPGLNNAKLREFGLDIEFYPGIPALFALLKTVLHEATRGAHPIRLENYIVSTGLAEMIRGSAIAPHVDGIWASEFIETPAIPGASLSGAPESGLISQVAAYYDNTLKTRALFEINKGVNVNSSIGVNDLVPEMDRRVPMRNIIYIADGPSDIPAFSVVKERGGKALAVYDPASDAQYEQAELLHDSGRVNDYKPADFTAHSDTTRWLTLQIRRMAERIEEAHKRAVATKVKPEPKH